MKKGFYIFMAEDVTGKTDDKLHQVEVMLKRMK